jgi:DNA repair protein RadA/Sms
MAKSKIKTVYTCQNCGAQRPRWEGKCSDCNAWNTFVEETYTENPGTRGLGVGKESSRAGTASNTRHAGLGRRHGKSASGGQSQGPVEPKDHAAVISLDAQLEIETVDRTISGIQELDRVLGGGLVAGSFTLIGGDPGIGKSTLLMQMAGGLAKNNQRVLYISGEESVNQTGLRAQRLGVRSPLVDVVSESNLDVILEIATARRPQVMIIDSIQTVFLPALDSAPGTVSQVRECAGHLMMFAKSENVSVFLIGHVTKDGSIAGPKVLEHMVDTVLAFEGDQHHQFRLLRSLKNRFGAAFELGVFQMAQEGLREVSNPSEMFLEDRGTQLIGSGVFASMEGSRPLLCEIQALTVSTPMAMPRRTAIGLDPQRLHLMIAVLEKHMSLSLYQSDVFLNVVGGLRLTEPAADLAVAAAIFSSFRGFELDPKMILFGEIGLTGEVRAVPFAETRLKEAAKLGFTRFLIPESNRRHLADVPAKILNKVEWLKHVRDLRLLAPRGHAEKADASRLASSASRPTPEAFDDFQD